MDTQMLFTWIAIGIAAAYLGLCVRQAWRGGKAAGGCGCAKQSAAKEEQQPPLIAPEQIRMRRR